MPTMDYWRKYFESAKGDIFDVIQQAIMVAASDSPNEFRIRRDEIAEKLYTCRLSRCSGCDDVELSVPKKERVVDVVKKNSSDDGIGDGFVDVVSKKESKGTCSTNVHSDFTNNNNNNNKVSNISYNDAEALTDMLEEESQMIEEVFRIKEILENSVDQSSSLLLESLRRLELMNVTVQILTTTNIGTVVSGVRKHPIKEISKLSRSLVRSWKDMISEWVASTEAAKATGSNDSPDSVNPSVVIDEEEFGLPSPPLDSGIFFAPEPATMELSKFFDGMDDLGNLDCGQNDDENGRMTNTRKENNNIQKRKPQNPREQNVLSKGDKDKLMLKQETVVKETKPSNTALECAKPSKLGLEKANSEVKLQQKLDTTRIQRKPISSQPDKSKPPGAQLDQKLEMAKRKLHQGYQQAENAKKQRTIQVMELHDLPKQSNSKFSHVKPGSHNRNWSNGRR